MVNKLVTSCIRVGIIASFTVSDARDITLRRSFFSGIFPGVLPVTCALLVCCFLQIGGTRPILLVNIAFILSVIYSTFNVLWVRQNATSNNTSLLGRFRPIRALRRIRGCATLDRQTDRCLLTIVHDGPSTIVYLTAKTAPLLACRCLMRGVRRRRISIDRLAFIGLSR